MSSEKKEKKQHKMTFNIKEKLKKTFSKEHLKEVFTGEEQKKHLKQGSYSSIMTVIVRTECIFRTCFGFVLYFLLNM